MTRAALLLALLSTTAHADAPPPPSPPPAPPTAPPTVSDASQVSQVMESYFAGEKIEGYVFFSLGYVALFSGGMLALQNKPFSIGLSIPLLAVGVIELCAGLWLLAQTDQRVVRLNTQIRANPEEFQQRELRRMQGVNRGFRILKIVEGTLLAVGAIGAFVAALTRQEALLGAGIGLSLQALAMLILDTAAERRAHRYVNRLTSISIGPPPTGAGLSIGVAHRF